ncbi:MAG: DUF1499 domain-containing protein [Spirochaetota bacterium]
MELLGIFITCCMSVLSPFSGITSDEKLHGCTPSPNCVSSASWRYNFIHYTSPIKYQYSQKEAFQRLHSYLQNSENVYLEEVRPLKYIRATYFTKVLRFPDRIELFFPSHTKKEIHVRSHSWLGFWDFFANRRRIQRFRKIIQSQTSPQSDTLF